jgi:hypothetical protein
MASSRVGAITSARGLAQQAVHQSDQEGASLTSAGLGLPGDIAAGQCNRQGQRLDGCAAGKARLVQTFLQQRMQVELGKEGFSEYGLGHEWGVWYGLTRSAQPGPAVRQPWDKWMDAARAYGGAER